MIRRRDRTHENILKIFQRFFPHFQNEIDMHINFYIGCLLWAVYIKQFEDKEISENPMLGQDISDEQGLYTINYMIDYLPKFEKDSKYYINKYFNNEIKILDIGTGSGCIAITLNKLMYENNKISFSMYKKTNDELVKKLYNKDIDEFN